MSDDECHDCHDCNCKPKEINVEELGPESVELEKMFKELNDHLTHSLETRHKILSFLHEKATSQEMKEKFDKVIESRHPVLIQFVFGMEEQ